MEDDIEHRDNWSDPCVQNVMDRMSTGHYPNLQVFMSRNNDDHKLPQQFLYIDPCSFGKVTVLDLWFSDDNNIIEVRESTSGTIKVISVDVNARPELMMVRWDDIVRMVMREGLSSTSSDQLLDFDF